MADTIFALASGRPPAAISVIRISGPAAHAAARQLVSSLPPARSAVVRRLRHPGTGELLDDALLLRFDAPASATGEDVIELHCHGGRAVVDAVLESLASITEVRQAEPGEFTRRAFENSRLDLTEAEGLADLIQAETQSQRRAALLLAEGGLKRQIHIWQEQLLSLSARVERLLDYDEDEEGIDASLLCDCTALSIELHQWLARPGAEPLKDGVLVVLAGPPNAGKSSLLNAIVGEERAIVSDLPGTTRDHIEVSLSLRGVPLRLTDTAGLREGEDPVELAGINRARRLVDAADVLVWMGSPEEAPQHPRAIVVQPKADLAARRPEEGSIAVSAITGEGLSALLDAIERCARGILPAEDAIALNRRQSARLGDAAAALSRASSAPELVLFAEELRLARTAFDRLTGRAGVEDVLDALFGRFCLGK